MKAIKIRTSIFFKDVDVVLDLSAKAFGNIRLFSPAELVVRYFTSIQRM